jgi:hypothetical protein
VRFRRRFDRSSITEDCGFSWHVLDELGGLISANIRTRRGGQYQYRAKKRMIGQGIILLSPASFMPSFLLALPYALNVGGAMENENTLFV